MARRLPLFPIIFVGLLALASAVATLASPSPLEALRAGSSALFWLGIFAGLLTQRLQWQSSTLVTTFPPEGARFSAQRQGRLGALMTLVLWLAAGVLATMAYRSIWSVLLASGALVALIAMLIPRSAHPLLLIDQHGIHDRRIFSTPVPWEDIKGIRYRAEWLAPWMAVFLQAPEAYRTKRARRWLFPPKLTPVRLIATRADANLAEIEAALRQFAPPRVLASFDNWRDDDWETGGQPGNRP